eukprot:s1702_g10.t1
MLPYLAHPGICGGLHVAWLEIPGNMEAAALRVNLQSAFAIQQKPVPATLEDQGLLTGSQVVISSAAHPTCKSAATRWARVPIFQPTPTQSRDGRRRQGFLYGDIQVLTRVAKPAPGPR